MGKKVIRLTETDIENIIKRVLVEQSSSNDIEGQLKSIIRSISPSYSANKESFLSEILKNDPFKFYNFLPENKIIKVREIGLSPNQAFRGTFSPHLSEPGNEDQMFKVWRMITEDLIKFSLIPTNILCKNGFIRNSEIIARKNDDMNNLYKNYVNVFVDIVSSQLTKIGVNENDVCNQG